VRHGAIVGLRIGPTRRHFSAIVVMSGIIRIPVLVSLMIKKPLPMSGQPKDGAVPNARCVTPHPYLLRWTNQWTQGLIKYPHLLILRKRSVRTENVQSPRKGLEAATNPKASDKDDFYWQLSPYSLTTGHLSPSSLYVASK
jgi:hypothetical protein